MGIVHRLLRTFATVSPYPVDRLARGSVMDALNVFKKPLVLFSRSPMTGFYRDGYCRSGAADFGNHAIAGVVTEEFLDFSASQGNDLRVAGLTGGCKWCLCMSRWLEAFDAMREGKISRNGVPKVQLDATHESALLRVDLETLKSFATENLTNGVNGVNGVNGTHE